MAWITENWAIITTLASVAIALLNAWGKSRYAKVIEALVVSIETADAKDVKALAQNASFKNGTNVVLAKLVTKLTEGEK